MCGRYALYGPVSRHRQHFGVEPDNWIDRYNIAPTQLSPVIRASKEGTAREVIEAQWGLLPSWAKDPAAINHPINARAETVATKPMFRTAFKRFRVLVPASGFYEWKQLAGGKQPYFIRLRGEEPMGFGGLLERWEGPEGVVWTYCIIVTEPNELVAGIHNRMPVIIRPEDYDAWLDPGLIEPGIVSELMAPYPSDLMEAYPVGRAVGNPRSQGPELVAPMQAE
jgi:putative SOS response-associated peptidase YedK